MKKITTALLSLFLLAGCSGQKPADSSSTAVPEETPETTAETVTEYDFSELKVIAPMGAPALSLLPLMKESSNVTTVNGPENLQAALVAPEHEYDVIVAPTNLGVKLANAGKSEYRMLAVVTWGNLYIVAEDDDVLNREGKLALFGEQAVGGLVFNSLYDSVVPEVTWYASVSDAQAALLSGEADSALLAEPAATATIAKLKEQGKEYKIAVDLQKEWGDGYPQAALYVLASAYEENSDMYDALVEKLYDYEDSVNPNDTSALVADIESVGAENLGVPNAQIAGKVWNRMGVRIVRASGCVEELEKFLTLFDIQGVADAVLD